MKENESSSLLNMNRRDFVKASAIGAGAVVLPSVLKAKSKAPSGPDGKINVAIVGVGGKGVGPTVNSVDENVVALCDVDAGYVASQREGNSQRNQALDEAIKKHEANGAKWFKDYRVMFDELGDKIDAVIISIPDHMHFPVAMSAINLGKHVYCEKPLTHTVDEARKIAAAAKKAGVVTQMGNQGHSLDGTRNVYEWLQAGVIGDVKEVHSWTDRPAIFWQQGLEKPDHSKLIPVVPEGLDWNLWQGVAEHREYDPAYVPFSWRAYTDYGCGALGDMACHIMDSAFWGLGLGSPTEIEASTTKMNGYSFPVSSVVTYKFPARGNMPPVTYKWYDGDLRPAVPDFLKDVESLSQANFPSNGSLIVGDGAAILTDTYSQRAQILPNEKFMELRPSLPQKTLRRIKSSHLEEFFNAIKEGREASSDFSYAGPFTETVLLGVIAQRTGRKLKFDGAAGKFIGDDEANKLIAKDYPQGWILS